MSCGLTAAHSTHIPKSCNQLQNGTKYPVHRRSMNLWQQHMLHINHNNNNIFGVCKDNQSGFCCYFKSCNTFSWSWNRSRSSTIHISYFSIPSCSVWYFLCGWRSHISCTSFIQFLNHGYFPYFLSFLIGITFGGCKLYNIHILSISIHIITYSW